jgi:anaerobic ribonucleoside-triphosphate reductase activating protein
VILHVGQRVSRTEAEGPGRRFALWVQGCTLRCAGCCNPQLFAASGGSALEVDALAIELQSVLGEVEGITFLGGEPFEQAAAVAALARRARAMKLSVMTFTGYRLEEIECAIQSASGSAGLTLEASGARALLESTDLLVDGRYESNQPETGRRWAGSTNQRFHYLTDRYRPGIEHIHEGEQAQTVEARLRLDGTVEINGWPALVGLTRSLTMK